MKYIFFLLTAGLIFISCKKNNSGTATLLSQCNDTQHFDSAAIPDRIAGTWKWIKQSCFWSGGIRPADKDVRVTFNSNATFTVSENSSVIIHGNWSLRMVDGNARELDLSAPSEYLYGRIVFCGNNVLFNNSYLDGCDNLFEKIN